jgi:hypothetical protein
MAPPLRAPLPWFEVISAYNRAHERCTIAAPAWQISRQDYESCSCEFLRSLAGPLAAGRFALAHASRSRAHKFGFNLDGSGGNNNGQYARFS